MHISNIYLAYVKRFFLDKPDTAIQVLQVPVLMSKRFSSGLMKGKSRP